MHYVAFTILTILKWMVLNINSHCCATIITSHLQDTSLSSQSETLCPLNSDFPFFPCPAYGKHHSTLCLYEFDYKGNIVFFLLWLVYFMSGNIFQGFPHSSVGKESIFSMQETPAWFLGQEDLLEKGLATHSSILGFLLWLSW